MRRKRITRPKRKTVRKPSLARLAAVLQQIAGMDALLLAAKHRKRGPKV